MAEFRWFGHTCFRIRSREATIITDPVDRATGYAMPKQTADIVTLSNGDPSRANLSAIKPEFKTVHGPGEYEIHEVFITGIRTYHDAERGKLRGYNTVYLFEIEGMIVAHLGNLGHALTEEQTEAMSKCDVLMIPAGGDDVISPEIAAEVIAQLEPKIVLPMRYATEIGDRDGGTLEEFCKRLGVDVPQPEEKLVVRQSDLAETMKVVALTPESEAARR
jgi:L-ascorbate metabolism protein UlaG (beta-lactamase superfamily)